MRVSNPPTQQRTLANGSTSGPTTTSATFVVMPQMTVTMTTYLPDVVVTFCGTFEVITNDDWDMAIFSDGVEVLNTRRNSDFFGGSLLGLTPGRQDGAIWSLQGLVQGLVGGSHTFDVRWKVNAGTARAIGTERNIIAVEVL